MKVALEFHSSMNALGADDISLLEQHFLDLARQAFLTLVDKKKTRDRIAHVPKDRKPPRN